MMEGSEKQDTIDQKNQANQAGSSVEHPNDRTVDEPTPTHKKLTSGNFVTPTATATQHPTSQPNMLGNIPIVGGLLGGTGGPL